MRLRALLTLLVATALTLLASTGCSSQKPNDDPLVGTWVTQTTSIAGVPGGESETITFTANGTYTAVDSTVNASNASSKPGCTEALTDTGTFSDDGTMLTMTVDDSASQVADTGCPNASDDGTSKTTPFPGSLNSRYTVTETTLTLLAVGGWLRTFTRR
jgi:hypothetical protein